jgi:competence protein ComEC
MGANFNADFNIGSVVVVISHGNNDHVGGLLGIESYIRIRKLVSNRKDLSTKLPAQLCAYNKDWNWDGVEFRFLQSALDYSPENNNSCMLQIRS